MNCTCESQFGRPLLLHLLRAEHQHLSLITASLWYCLKQFSQFRNEEPCPGMSRCRNTTDLFITVRILLPPCFYELLAENVDTTSRCVIEKIVAMFNGRVGCDYLASLCIEDKQARGRS